MALIVSSRMLLSLITVVSPYILYLSGQHRPGLGVSGQGRRAADDHQYNIIFVMYSSIMKYQFFFFLA
jgi:hypothetical protein